MTDPRELPPPRNVLIRMFMLIAEPRGQRVLLFVIYLCLAVGGLELVLTPPGKFHAVLGFGLVLAFGALVLVAGAFGAIAVLPGIRWLERAGIVALWTGLFIFEVLVAALQASAISFIFGLVLAGFAGLRFIMIRQYALTPKLG
jgi:hypothetical protein